MHRCPSSQRFHLTLTSLQLLDSTHRLHHICDSSSDRDSDAQDRRPLCEHSCACLDRVSSRFARLDRVSFVSSRRIRSCFPCCRCSCPPRLYPTSSRAAARLGCVWTRGCRCLELPHLFESSLLFDYRPARRPTSFNSVTYARAQQLVGARRSSTCPTSPWFATSPKRCARACCALPPTTMPCSPQGGAT
jgi:hypothetical protein